MDAFRCFLDNDFPSTSAGLVQHEYQDHANELGPGIDRTQALLRLTFPLKLYNMLQEVEKDSHLHIVSWQPHGRSFLIHQPDLFPVVTRRYFGLDKVKSFKRQVK